MLIGKTLSEIVCSLDADVHLSWSQQRKNWWWTSEESPESDLPASGG